MSMKAPVRATQRNAVVFPGAVGDFVCFLPALQHLARRAFVELFAHSILRELVPDGVLLRSLESYEIARLFVAEAETDERLRRFYGGFDSAYSWMGSRDTRFAAQFQQLCRGESRVFPFAPAGWARHQSDYYLGCLGIDDCGALPEITLQPLALAAAADFWARRSLNAPVLMIAPGSGAREKNWSIEGFLHVAQWWRETIKGKVVVLVGPVEEERGGLEPLFRAGETARGLSLGQAAAFIARADFYLGNDSGISHIAAAVGTPALVLFGPADPRVWGPRGRSVRVITRAVECSPCAPGAMKSCGHRRCLAEIAPGEVIRHMHAILHPEQLDKAGTAD